MTFEESLNQAVAGLEDALRQMANEIVNQVLHDLLGRFDDQVPKVVPKRTKSKPKTAESPEQNLELKVTRKDRYRILLDAKTGFWSRGMKNIYQCQGQTAHSNEENLVYSMQEIGGDQKSLAVTFTTLLSKWKHTEETSTP